MQTFRLNLPPPSSGISKYLSIHTASLTEDLNLYQHWCEDRNCRISNSFSGYTRTALMHPLDIWNASDLHT